MGRQLIVGVVSLPLVVWWSSFVFFYLYAANCQVPSTQSTRCVVVGDVHVLGERRRQWIERQWIDWQIWLAWTTAQWKHTPEMVWFMGDQLDEGTRATNFQVYKSYAKRFRQLVSATTAKETLTLLGNHDAAFGNSMTQHLIERHEAQFGKTNRLVQYKGIMYLQLNTMALEDDVFDPQVHADAIKFLEIVEDERRATEYKAPLILLTHLPLYRADDSHCGPLRAQEGGHITYEAPDFQYLERDHVLSKSLSSRLLKSLRPMHIFSAHTHANCHHVHQVGFQSKPIGEFTVPTFTWGMRPDPSYAIADISPSSVVVTACSLPKELEYIAFLVAVVVLHCFGVWKFVQGRVIRPKLKK